MSTSTSKNKKAFANPRGTTFLFDPDELTIIGLDTDDDETHALYDPRVKLPVDEDDVKNVDHFGIINPVTITKRDGVAIVVAGRDRVRRARAAKKLQEARGEKNTIRVPCLVRSGDDAYLMEVMISENEGRRDDDVAAKIRKINRMSDRGIPMGQIAAAFCVTPKTIGDWIALGEAHRDVQRAAAAGAVSTTAAIQLARIPADEQVAALAEVVSEGKSTTDAARRVVSKRRRGGDDGDGVGVTGRKAQRKMLEIAVGGDAEEVDPYFEGAADALRIVLGEKPVRAAKARKLLKGLAKK